MLILKQHLVTVKVLYFIPGYQYIVSELVWQTLDRRPEYPRIHRFLNFWRSEIDAVIAEIVIFDSPHSDWRNGIIIPLN